MPINIIIYAFPYSVQLINQSRQYIGLQLFEHYLTVILIRKRKSLEIVQLKLSLEEKKSYCLIQQFCIV